MYYGESKPKGTWQKAFIDDVFAHKTKHNNTFSKIILDHPDLLNSKSDHIPKSLFKFYRPTSENILDIRKRRLWFAHPATLNDPFDCHTGYDPESYEKHALVEHIRKHGWVEPANSKDGFTFDELHRLSESTTEYDHWYSTKAEEYRTLLWKLLKDKSERFNDEIYGVVRQATEEVEGKINRLRGTNIRVASFSALDRYKDFHDIIQMWSHYTDNHAGFCVEYDSSLIRAPVSLSLKDDAFHSNQSAYMDERTRVALFAGVFPIIYTASRVNIPRTKLRRIRLDSKGNLEHDNDIDAILYKTYIVKSAKWSYEKEWRFILDGEVCSYYENKIPFPYIKRIFLGCNMTNKTIDTMIEIAAEVGAEVVMMVMGPRKFVLEENNVSSYEWKRERSKWNNPFA